MIINVGSESIHKLGPAIEVCQDIYPLLWKNNVFEIKGHKVKTGVSEQPYGINETMTGAINRAEAVWKLGTIALGIEGGLVDINNSQSILNRIVKYIPFFGKKFYRDPIYLCLAVVVAIDVYGQKYFATSAGMHFPLEDILRAKKNNITVGQELAKFYGGDHTDPRSMLSFGKTTRRESIKEAIKLAFVSCGNLNSFYKVPYDK